MSVPYASVPSNPWTILLKPDIPAHYNEPIRKALMEFLAIAPRYRHAVHLYGVSVLNEPGDDPAGNPYEPVYLVSGPVAHPYHIDNWVTDEPETIYLAEDILILRPPPPTTHSTWSSP